MLILHSYFRSSAAYRVRIALHLKGIPFEYKSVHLLKEGGEQNKSEYRRLNPMGEIPSIEHDGKVIAQSLPIIEYIDQIWPKPRLIPQDAYQAACVRQLCENVNSSIHPIQNLKVLQELEKRFKIDQDAKNDWAAVWIKRGFEGLEKLLQATAGNFSFKDEVTAADLFLVPQVLNARRFNVDLSPFPTITRIDEVCTKLDSFKKAHPSVQPDTPKE